ncbi:DUF3854 domain-containing protein, partial [Mariniphaga sediminis]|uniref:DUF3854 domain-containing protein n=1 Tax=Mariniphaga sediminis TaxID=1628158 RepID=UPI003565D01D
MMYSTLLDNAKNKYLIHTLLEMGLPEDENSFVYHEDGRSAEHPYIEAENNGNIKFYVQSIYGGLETYSTENPAETKFRPRDEKTWYLRRFISPKINKEGDLQKYSPAMGSGMRLFFPKNIVEAYQSGTEIETLFIVEGFKKAFVGYLNGLHIVGMNGLTGWKTPNQKDANGNAIEINEIREDLKELIKVCNIQKIVIVFDADLFTISEKSHSFKNPTTKRPNNFYKAALKAKELFTSVADVYLAHPHAVYDAKGLDDIYLKFRNYSAINSSLPRFKIEALPVTGTFPSEKLFQDQEQPEFVNRELEVTNDLLKAIETNKNGDYFAVNKLSGLTDFKIKEYFHLGSADEFYEYHKKHLQKLKRTQLFFYRMRFNIAEDYSQIEKSEKQSDDEDIKFEYIGNRTYIVRPGRSRKFIANFIMKVLCVIDSADDSKRVVKQINDENRTQVIEVDAETHTSRSRFRAACARRANFQFRGDQDDLDDWVMELFRDEPMAIELKQLGYDDHYDFYAFANGIVTDQGWKGVDKYGMLTHDEQTFYLAPYSEFTKWKRKHYSESRKFAHLPPKNKVEVTFDDYISLYMQVFEDNGLFTINHAIRTMFGDIAFTKINGDPILFASGMPEQGKSKCIEFARFFWGQETQTAINLGSGKATPKYIMARFSQIANVFIHLDEFNPELRMDIIDMVKGFYDRYGRGTKAFSNDLATNEMPILSSCAISGEHKPTKNAALFTRMLLLEFPFKKYTPEEAALFNKLQDMGENGITHLTVHIVKHRKLILEKWDSKFKMVIDQLHDHFRKKKINSRLLKTVAANLTPSLILQQAGVLNFGITEQDMITRYYTIIDRQFSLQKENTDSRKFWDAFEQLCQMGIISINKGDYKWEEDSLVVCVNSVHAKYHKYMIDNHEPKILGKSDWISYLEADPAHVPIRESNGRMKRVRFAGKNSSAALYFHYEKLKIDIR